MSFLLSSSERKYILNGCRDNCRIDGRTCDELRGYTIVVGGDPLATKQKEQRKYEQQQNNNDNNKSPPLILSNGSSRLFLAAPGSATSTHIICSVKAELVHPSLHNPFQGQIQIHVDYAASASAASCFVSATSCSSINNVNQSRQQQQESYDYIQSTLSRLLQTHLLDLDALCIVPYHYVWNLQIDLFILSGMGGNLIDACSHALRAALQQTKLPFVATNTTPTTTKTANTAGASTSANADLIVDSDVQNAITPPGSDKAPIIVTVTVIKDEDSNDGDDHGESISSGWYLLLDATLEEQACSYCQIHAAVQNEYICALTKSGGGSIPLNLLNEITSLCLEFSRKQQQQHERYYVTSLPDNSNYGWLQEQFAIH